jgi:hypothetical protein
VSGGLREVEKKPFEATVRASSFGVIVFAGAMSSQLHGNDEHILPFPVQADDERKKMPLGRLVEGCRPLAWPAL